MFFDWNSVRIFSTFAAKKPPFSVFYDSIHSCYHSLTMKRPESVRENNWQIAPPVPTHIQAELNYYHPILLQTLYNRGIMDVGHIQAFLDGQYLESTDPFLLTDMDKAVSRIRQAIKNDELIIVYGDYDADGVTATVLLTQALRGLGVDHRSIRPYIPDRFTEGYGLNRAALDGLREIGATLAITVDCGIRAHAEIEHANEIGLDIIVTDHHSLGDRLPPALAMINPKREESQYPEKMLAGVGIAYKLAQALYQEIYDGEESAVEQFLDLVAIGTVADLAPLLGENRRLVIEGLSYLNNLHRPGLAALANYAGLRRGSINAESIGFGIGPRINAAGRLAHAYTAARLLAANNDLSARQLAKQLNELNKRRQDLTKELGKKAESMVDPQDLILIAGDKSFDPGVVGLVASRLSEKNYRPAIVLEVGPELSHGSCRSIAEFHITEALDQTADLLVRHGGHAQAAGLTIRSENITSFTNRMKEIANDRLAGQELKPTLFVDAEIKLDDIDWALYGTLEKLEPTGYANPLPVFLSRNVEVLGHRIVGQGGDHLQINLTSHNGSSAHQMFPAIAFRQAAWAAEMPQLIDVVYSINLNEWNGRRNLQLVIQDLRPANTQL